MWEDGSGEETTAKKSSLITFQKAITKKVCQFFSTINRVTPSV